MSDLRVSAGGGERIEFLRLVMQAGDRRRLLAWLDAGFVFALALGVRYVFVVELREHSYAGNLRVSDAQTYFQLAQQIVAGTAPFEPYWQAPLYPLFLAGFQSIFGDSLHAVQWLHMAIGALNCVLVFWLCDRLFGGRAAWIVWAPKSRSGRSALRTV